MLTETKETPILSRLKQLGSNYVSRSYMVQILEESSALVDSPGRAENEKQMISEYYEKVTHLSHLIQS
jgi:hypothetical protein